MTHHYIRTRRRAVSGWARYHTAFKRQGAVPSRSPAVAPGPITPRPANMQRSVAHTLRTLRANNAGDQIRLPGIQGTSTRAAPPQHVPETARSKERRQPCTKEQMRRPTTTTRETSNCQDRIALMRTSSNSALRISETARRGQGLLIADAARVPITDDPECDPRKSLSRKSRRHGPDPQARRQTQGIRAAPYEER